MKTIIQTIGPLYGDDVNGSVFGQPNGSVYTPPANGLIVIQEDAAVNLVFNHAGFVSVGPTNQLDKSRVDLGVICQVEWNAIYELATDSAFTTIVSSRRLISTTMSSLPMERFGLSSGYTVVNGTTYYGRVRIVEANGSAEIMKSNTYTFTGVV